MTHPLLILEPPIQVLPALAELLGFNEAAALQEIHYWLNSKEHTDFRDGRDWVPNVFDHLAQRFFFWDNDTIGYVLAQLEQSGILMVLAPPGQDFNKKAEMTTYHTINYELLKERHISPIKLVPVVPFIQDNPFATNKNTHPPFMVVTHEKGDNLYTIVAQDLSHFLTSELILEIQDRVIDPGMFEDEVAQEAFATRQVICHFPKIADDELKKFVWEDVTLYGIIMVTFQMKIMKQLLLFCATHDAANLVIFADDIQADELGIYWDFLTYKDQVLTSRGEKTEMVIPAHTETFDSWIDFMETVTHKFHQTLWREQKKSPAIRDYLTQGLEKV